MKILVASCDNNVDTFDAFHHCMEKYWKKHPEVIYKTETTQNPYYKTIARSEPLNQWTAGMIWTLEQIKDEHVLLMMDDCFIRRPVDTERLEYADAHLTGNVANINLERAWDVNDLPCDLVGFLKRREGAMYAISIMCGIWQREKLIEVLWANQGAPWDVERQQNTCGFDYLINAGADIVDFGYVRTWVPFGISRGKWCREVIPFFEHEGIKVDYERRGVWW